MKHIFTSPYKTLSGRELCGAFKSVDYEVCGLPEEYDVHQRREGDGSNHTDAFIVNPCPKGFVPKVGTGNQRICIRCDRSYEEHKVVVQ